MYGVILIGKKWRGVRQLCANIWKQEKKYSYLENLDSRIALTTDMWTSNQKKGYMDVTAHFIDSTWVLQIRILSFIYVPTPHTKKVLSSTLMECILDWNIDRKFSTIMVDNCSTNNEVDLEKKNCDFGTMEDDLEVNEEDKGLS